MRPYSIKALKAAMLLFLVLPFGRQGFAQDYGFRPPLDIPLTLSGTFAEIRGNHFHAGLDLRTNSVEGLNVYAIGDGYVSRVRVSPWGYGKAVYITHPNGITSVYAHLQRFQGPLADFVLRQQYYRESFEVDLYLPAGQLDVKKGDVIGLSGNTGGSGGPHLHFELRRTASQHPVNPLDYGFRIGDSKVPVIRALRIYPMPGKSTIDGSAYPRDIAVRRLGDAWMPDPGDTIEVKGPFYMGISGYDQQDGSYNKNGVYEISLEVDGKLFWKIRSDEFSYDETRYVNSLIDYPEYKAHGSRYVLTYVQPNNRLGVYEKLDDRGVIRLDEPGLHSLTYRLRDYQGNESAIVLHVDYKGRLDKPLPPLAMHIPLAVFSHRADNHYDTDGFRISVPRGSLYDSLGFLLNRLPAPAGSLCPAWEVHDPSVPLHKSARISLRADSVPEGLASKVMVTRTGPGGRNMLSTSRSGDWFSASIREFGTYTLMVDTVPPRITPVNISEGVTLPASSSIRVKVADLGSGIVSYKASIDGKWILMEYEPKKSLLFHEPDEHTPSGKHLFRLVVTDDAGNESEFSCTFSR